MFLAISYLSLFLRKKKENLLEGGRVVRKISRTYFEANDLEGSY